MKPFSPLDSLIPHKPPMRLVDAFTEVTDTVGRVTATIGEDHLFLRSDKTLAPEAYCEMIAQCFAACESQRREWKGLSTEGGGYLASVRDFEVLGSAKVGDLLTVSSVQQDDCFGTRIVQGEVFCEGKKLAQGTVYIFMWEGKNPPEMK